MPIFQFDYTIVLRDSGNMKTTMNYDLGDFDYDNAPLAFTAAQSAATQVRGSLVDVTDAFIASERLVYRISDDNQIPPGMVDVTDEAYVLTHLKPANQVEKLHGIRIPAPIADLFVSPKGAVDLANTDLIQYVQQLAQHTRVSDGEQIVTATGSDGMKAGFWRSRARRYRGLT